MATPVIEYPGDWIVTAATERVLGQMFHDYANVVLQKEFTEGQSSTQVFLVEAHPHSGGTELPAVVKIGPSEVILPEWEAASTYARRQLPDFVEIEGDPTVVEELPSAGVNAGLRYRVAGDGIFPTESLRAFSRTAEAEALWRLLTRRILPQLDRIWTQDARRETRPVHASYDRVLPVNLLIAPVENGSEIDTSSVLRLDAATLQAGEIDFTAVPSDAIVELRGFVVTEIERGHRTVTLNLPVPDETAQHAAPWHQIRRASFRLRLLNVPDSMHVRLGEVIAPVVGRVRATRQELLQRAVQEALGFEVEFSGPTLALADHTLPNPLQRWPALLTETLPMKIGTVHGDFNLGNILVDTDALTSRIIDCAHIHRDHALYDLVRLEAEFLLHPLAFALFRGGHPPTQIVQLYRWLDHVTRRDPHAAGQFAVPAALQAEMPTLLPTYIALCTIRTTVRQYLADPSDWREYYSGLALALLGSLKFASLNRAQAGQQPKAIAFWGAATILAQIDGALADAGSETDWDLIDFNEGAEGEQTVAERTTQHVDQRSYDQRSGGIYFEGNQNVEIGGDVIDSETVNKSNFHGAVSGPVHTGSGNIEYASGAPEPSGPRIITNVWYTPEPYRFFDVRNPVLGRLEIETEAVRFISTEGPLLLEQIRAVAHTRMARDLKNNWVEVVYGAGAARRAYFSRATRLGIGNLIGGSDEILQALRHCIGGES